MTLHTFILLPPLSVKVVFLGRKSAMFRDSADIGGRNKKVDILGKICVS